MSWKVSFNKIYLIARHGSSNAEFRITEREGKTRPSAIQFIITKRIGPEQEGVGTLVLDEGKWQTWFGGKKFMPGMETAGEAAKTLTQGNTEIYYGCPLCEFATKDYDEHKKHINSQVEKFLEYMDIELVEEKNDETAS